MERKIQSARMGSQAIEERTGHSIKAFDAAAGWMAIETNDATGEVTKELWLGPGAFIVYKES